MNMAGRLPRTSTEAAAAAVKAMGSVYEGGRSPLYAALCDRIPEDAGLVALASHTLAPLPAAHLFAAVHYLLLCDPADPLAQYFATLNEPPAPPENAFPEFARFCRGHHAELVHLLETRTVQATGPERCPIIMPLLSHIADHAGEPLNLIEIGCSAGILLAFDKFAYAMAGRGFLSTNDAPLTLAVDVVGGPELHIPRVGNRIGIDLRPVDARLEDERLWLMAQTMPENRERRARLSIALDVVTRADISMFKGDALELLPRLIAESPEPLCIYHSACVIYWSNEAKAALDALLLQASRGRRFYRLGMEPDIQAAVQSRTELGAQASSNFMDIVVTRYRNGTSDSRVVARSSASGTTITWLS